MQSMRTFLFSNYLIVSLLFALPDAKAADVYLSVSNDDEIIISSEQSSDDAIRISDDEHSQALHAQSATKIKPAKSLSLAKKYAMSDKLPFEKEVMVAAHITALEPALIHAVIAVESGHNPYARSPKGAFGLMQLMPSTAKKFKTHVGDTPTKHIVAGSKYLRELLNAFNGDLPLALAAYNAGPHAVRKHHGKIPPYAETQQYVPLVLGYFEQFTSAQRKISTPVTML